VLTEGLIIAFSADIEKGMKDISAGRYKIIE